MTITVSSYRNYREENRNEQAETTWIIKGKFETSQRYHFPAFCCPFSMLHVSECGLRPFGGLLVGIRYLESVSWISQLPLADLTSAPGVTRAFPRDLVPFLRPAAVACMEILLPWCRWPPFRLVTDPPKVHPKRFRDEVSSGILPFIFWYREVNFSTPKRSCSFCSFNFSWNMLILNTSMYIHIMEK